MTKLIYLFLFVVSPLLVWAQNETDSSPFFNYTYDDQKGTVMLKVDHLDKEFLYIVSLAGGVGSNDLGLDRGKINSTRIVKWIKEGNKILLFQPNMEYRAISKNESEVKSVKEAFASSVLWGFDIVSKDGNGYNIDITKFLLQDGNGIAQYLKRAKEGSYTLDKSRTVVKSDQLFSFPKNTEFESLLTFVGEPSGKFLRSVTPTSRALTVVQHQSFVALPDEGYTSRDYHPYSGFNNISYYDFATPIHEPMEKRFITRHRLQKKNPGDAPSEAVEPIIYYVDSGCPEPVKSALIEGASWWNQAYTAAGYINAFQVKELPSDAHPLDVRYNVIQWVHRSTRGWSYGASVVDPRTGEIIKGHVSLGSLRVRQDFMIAQGVLAPYGNTEDHTPMTEMALARLRQLSAHEVGHTIGLAHNFAASTNDRASVMDYPHPLIKINGADIDISDAYDDKIGLWDKRTIVYGYKEFNNRLEDKDELTQILQETKELDLLYMSDADARPMGGAHPKAHLWDNGSDPTAELNRIMTLRKATLEKFGQNSITNGTPYSELEKVIVPVYLMHRYQVEGVAKIIGGVDYNYAVKGFSEPLNTPVPIAAQKAAIDELLKTLTPEALAYPTAALNLILPAAKGYGRNRESFGSGMNMVFDPLHSAEAYVNFIFTLMLHPDRLARVNMQETIGLEAYLNEILDRVYSENKEKDPYLSQLKMISQKVLAIHLIKLATNTKINKQVSAVAQQKSNEIRSRLNVKKNKDSDQMAHKYYINSLFNNMSKPELNKLPSLAEIPPGSPIGCGR